jgi:hypothetical protein
MDQITQSLLNDFIIENSLSSLSDSEKFEHFTSFLVTQKHYAESFLTDEICIGRGGDTGIDSIAIIANGQHITEPEEIDDLAETNGFLDIIFVFNQAERSSSFDTAKIGQFAFGVRDFFAPQPKLMSNEGVQYSRKIWEKTLEYSRLFRNGNPQCHLYYTTTGKWIEDQNLVTRRDSEKKDIEDLGLFRKVTFDCLGASELQSLSRQSKNSISTEIIFSEKTALPELPGIEQAYIGILPASEFLKLIMNDNQEIQSSIFYDNVRHWQDWNPVNKEINATASSDKKIFFPLLNNGVTIVARRVHPTGNKVLIEDYQIVNGCQTSFVLYHNREHCDETVMVPLRLISTQNEEIKKLIIHATNRQTKVDDQQFFALAEFPKKLEAYFPSFEDSPSHKLFYERRPGQYNAIHEVERVRIVNMTTLVRSFSAMFLKLPHRTTRNYKALLQKLGHEIFHADHKLEPYYVAAFSNYRMEFLFRNQSLAPDLKPARYHLLLALRLIIQGNNLPPINSNEMSRSCQKFMEILWDNDGCRDYFKSAEAVIRKIAAGNLHGDYVRTEAFTNMLLEQFKPRVQVVAQ